MFSSDDVPPRGIMHQNSSGLLSCAHTHGRLFPRRVILSQRKPAGDDMNFTNAPLSASQGTTPPHRSAWIHETLPADQDVESMLVYRWSSVVDGGPTVNQHWFNVFCLLGQSTLIHLLITGLDYTRVLFSFYQHVKYQLLNMLKIKHDINQKDFQTVGLYLVKSE